MTIRVPRRLAPALITAGLVLLTAGLVARPVSDPPPRERDWSHITEAVRTVSKFAELHQQLRRYIVCEETGRWHEWPCTQFTPPTQVPR